MPNNQNLRQILRQTLHQILHQILQKKSAIFSIVTELLIGASLALGATGFTYAFVRRAFLSAPDDKSQGESQGESEDKSETVFDDSGAGSGAKLAPLSSASGAASASAPTPDGRPPNIYPSPDSEVLGDGSDLASSRMGFTETLVGWGFAADGLLEIREDVSGARARFLPLHNQGVQRARLRAGRRYVWRVLANMDDGDSSDRQKILAGPYRFVLRGAP